VVIVGAASRPRYTRRRRDSVGGAELAAGTYGRARRLGAEFPIGVEIESAHPEADQIIALTLTSGAGLRGRSGVIATGVAYVHAVSTAQGQSASSLKSSSWRSNGFMSSSNWPMRTMPLKDGASLS
jgi:hypothetical protein